MTEICERKLDTKKELRIHSKIICPTWKLNIDCRIVSCPYLFNLLCLTFCHTKTFSLVTNWHEKDYCMRVCYRSNYNIETANHIGGIILLNLRIREMIFVSILVFCCQFSYAKFSHFGIDRFKRIYFEKRNTLYKKKF